MPETLKDHVLDLFSHHKIGTLATVRNNKPYSRFMLFSNEDLILYTATNKHAHKTEDIAENPLVHILLGYERDSSHQHYVEIEGKAEVEESQELRERFWYDSLKPWIASVDDPEYLLLKITPETILYFEKPGDEPKELSF
ncbi:general stress protein 26 [Bacillus pakistanensis]|uniref:General stress protein 26 n=1 Tax=Rossellomorea pakistanensis TaxID=992288 RepID=A0ABS2NJ39_9BACI|nr:pyridoxamine 5'-phosphate oxidase family protein [Bacillus pakistanensis]MBM7587546.1 general stress protein 26 [Bacillus pakistanensis]